MQVGFDEVEPGGYGPDNPRLLLVVLIHGSEGEVIDERTVSVAVRCIVAAA